MKLQEYTHFHLSNLVSVAERGPLSVRRSVVPHAAKYKRHFDFGAR